MIADKLYPSFYLIELEGKAISAIVTGDFGISKIAVGSFDFSSDMLALGGLNDAVRFIVGCLETTDLIEEISFNPEFFPTLKPLELTEEQKERIQKVEEEAEELQETLEESNQIAIPLTNVFDPIGDFIETRWIIKADDLKIEGRVAVQPKYYMLEKRKSMDEPKTQILIH